MKWILFLVTMLSYGQGVSTYLPEKKLLTKKFLEKISKSYRGQTQFAEKSFHHYRSHAQTSARGGSSGNREIQESDVFKVGSDGSKELFLLNSYRGFQVVSFEDGAELPKIKSRLPIYNNYNSEMYYLNELEIVLVVNSEWSFGRSYMGSNYMTKIYQIDVSNTSELKLISEKSIGGHLDSSRIVGDVLYTVTESYSSSQRKAQITSLKIRKSSMKQVDQKKLHTKDMYIGKMNVFKSDEKYYVLSSRANWTMNKGFVDLFDISSESGKISKVQTMKIKGRISEKSQMFMHDNHIVTVSNYRKDRNDLAKIAVEAFEVSKTSAIIESDEKKTLILRDTQGLNTNLQDVRVSGDLLYTFWVPANNIDPFDLVDLSDLKNGFKYLGRLHFDGWISKSFPVKYNNKNYIIGLGWIIPANQESNTRYPQAKLFEIKNTKKGIKHVEVDTLVLNEEKVWAALNGEDKNFEILPTSKSSFEILFPVTYRYQKPYRRKSGAKLVSVDLEKKELASGAKIQAESSWLKRVFSNKEINKINGFSDKELVTFGNTENKNGFLNTLSVLELARNIIDFKIISKTIGVQVIQNNQNIEFRKVQLSESDAEKNEVLEIKKVAGQVKWSEMTSSHSKMILAKTKKVQSKHGYENTQVKSISYVEFDFEKMKLSKSKEIHFSEEEMAKNRFYLKTYKLDGKLFFNVNSHGKIFMAENKQLVQMKLDQNCERFMKNESSYVPSFYNADNKLFAFNTAYVSPTDQSEKDRHERYKFSFIKEVKKVGTSLVCTQNAINIPGYPLDLAKGFLINGGSTYSSIIPFHYEGGSSLRGRIAYPYYANSKTFSLKLKKDKATLVDFVEKSITTHKYDEGKYLTHSSSEGRLDLWEITKKGEIISRPRYKNETRNSYLVKTFKAGKELFLMTKNQKLISMYKISSKSSDVKKVMIESKFDANKSDGNAEFVFGFNNITLNKDKDKAYVSQGMYGVIELIIK